MRNQQWTAWDTQRLIVTVAALLLSGAAIEAVVVAVWSRHPPPRVTPSDATTTTAQTATSSDGRTPATAVPGTHALISLNQPARTTILVGTQVSWLGTLDAGRRCYVTFESWPSGFPIRYVTVPEDWCEGLR
jgi:hypothetical protein